MKKKLMLFVLLIVGIHSETRADYQFEYISNIIQLLSFHIGSDTSFQDSNSNTSLILGGSIGVNYMPPPIFGEINELTNRWGRPIYGWRLKYLYTFDKPRTQSFGLVNYLHLSHGISAAALILGTGVLWETQEQARIGGYAETGITLWKIIPVNVDILYRINIYRFRNTSNDISHHLNVVFTFF
ncbi:hypothetical protein BBW65_05845 [Helicobacter enhydrae]|uniref:Outer membrane beta-barrel protein n=1 Tax=Helicobacter enhydrae TaxID=222136 RepID=A0A1B1U6M7_9HELI|nr:hypothetical protein [Helicobacter enhydrae]ANV98352.1 hypothetical protein BBW65_05845 [Helicobacter enhydrae]